MKIIGTIMEINPFHNGHKYFLENIRRSDEDILIVVISTTITQRGEISVLTKDVKTQILLDYGVDIVLELPAVLANQGGLYFAKHAIDMLKQFDITDLYFGSETANIKHLNSVVNRDISQLDFKNGIYKEELKNLQSNDILGISYLKAIKNTNIKPHLIKRISNNYNDTAINDTIASATSIRHNIHNTQLIKNTLPTLSLDNILNLDVSPLIWFLKNNISYAIHNKVFIYLSEKNQILNKIHKQLRLKNYHSLETLIRDVCDKNNSANKIRRIILNTILLITDDNYKVEYIRVLGFNLQGQQYLKNYKGAYITSLKNNNSNNAIIELRATELQKTLSSIVINGNDFKKPIIKE